MARGATGSSGEGGRDLLYAVARPQQARGNLSVDVHYLNRLSRLELREAWTQELRDKPPPTLGRDILALGIAYAMQERHRVRPLLRPEEAVRALIGRVESAHDMRAREEFR